MKIKIDRDKCIGCGSCMAMAPGTFEMDDENKAIVKADITDDVETSKMGADSCPTGAIIIEE